MNEQKMNRWKNENKDDTKMHRNLPNDPSDLGSLFLTHYLSKYDLLVDIRR